MSCAVLSNSIDFSVWGHELQFYWQREQKRHKRREGKFIHQDKGENLGLNCDLKTVVHESQQMSMHREGMVNVPHSAFCWSECKRWNVISCAYPLLLQYNPMAPLSVCYSHTYWLWGCCGVKRAIVEAFCPDVSLFKQWVNEFLKEKKNPVHLKCRAQKCLKTSFQIMFTLKAPGSISSCRLIFKCMIYK